MLRAIPTPYADTTAASLTYALGLDPLPALDALAVAPAPGVRLELRLLGASHQALLATPHGQGSEAVAYLPAAAGSGLPATVDTELAGGTYRFRADVRRCTGPELSERVAALTDRLGGRDDALVGVFPGVADAVTALRVESTGFRVGWRTWHAYPQTAELVTTTTLVVMPP